MGTSKLYEHSERVWREMYRQSLPVEQLDGPDAYLRGLCTPGTLAVFVSPLTLLIKGVGLPSGGDVPCHAGRSGA